MKFFKSYEKYSEAFKAHNCESMIAKHDKVGSIQSLILILTCFFSAISSFYISYKLIVYLDWMGLAGIPIFLLSSFIIFCLFFELEEKTLNSNSKMSILCNEIKDNIQEHEEIILGFYLEVKKFLKTNRKIDQDTRIIALIDNVIKAYALNAVKEQHIERIMEIHKYIENKNVFNRFVSFNKDTIEKIEKYTAKLAEKNTTPLTEKKPQYAEMV